MKKILVPTDFSKTAQYAIDFAYGLAMENNATLILANAIEYPVGIVADPVGLSTVPVDDTMFKLMVSRAKQKLETIKANLSTEEKVRIETHVGIGGATQAVVEWAAEHEVDLVVMGTQGASGIKEIVVGSNAEKVVRFVKCPVITLKKDADPGQIKNIAFASDFYDLDDAVVKYLKQLQNMFGAKIHFVRINTPNNFQRDKLTLQHMNHLIEKYMFVDYTFSVYNDVYEEDGMVNFAASINADMLAMATHGRTGLAHLFSGSIAEDVVNHVDKPVWTLQLSAASK